MAKKVDKENIKPSRVPNKDKFTIIDKKKNNSIKEKGKDKIRNMKIVLTVNTIINRKKDL